MNVRESSRLGFWVTGVALVLLVSPWVALAPHAILWGSLVAVTVIGSIGATAAIVNNRRSPSLTQLIHAALAEPVYATAGRPRVGARRGRTS